MPRPAADPDTVAAAVAAVRAGESLRDVGRRLGVSQTTVSRWAKAAASAAPAPADTTPAPPAGGGALLERLRGRAAAADDGADPPPDPFADIDPADSLGMLRRMRAESLRIAAQASAEGNHSAAQRAMRDAAGLAPVIAREERRHADDADTLHFSRDQIAAAQERMRARVAALASRPLLCADCGRELSIRLGTAGNPGKAGTIRAYLEGHDPEHGR